MKCFWCGEKLINDRLKGWLHPDGEDYKMTSEEGESFIDHYALPIPDKQKLETKENMSGGSK